MKVLVINSGSSSLKYRVYDMTNESLQAVGLVERIGIQDTAQVVNHEVTGREKVRFEKKLPDHKESLRVVLDLLTDPEHGILQELGEIGAVGHRVLHGKEAFADSIIVGPKELETLKSFIELGPLHMPPNIGGIEACISLMPDTPQVAVFDTAFHQTMPPHAYIYALNYEYYEKYGIRRYGFHGTSHKYITYRTAELLGKPVEQVTLITAHLGNGSSVAAVQNGKVVDTSMGFTPLEGLVMGTRCGDMDPAVVPFLGKKLNLGLDELDNLMNKKSGLFGLSGVSSDMRDVAAARKEGNKRAQLAFDAFTYRLAKYVAAYFGVLENVDALVFTGGIGENDAEVRREVCRRLKNLGVKIDEEVNSATRSKEQKLNTADSTFQVWVVPTNEELMIARDTLRLILAARNS